MVVMVYSAQGSAGSVGWVVGGVGSVGLLVGLVLGVVGSFTQPEKQETAPLRR